jgi:hypothetical protein
VPEVLVQTVRITGDGRLEVVDPAPKAASSPAPERTFRWKAPENDVEPLPGDTFVEVIFRDGDATTCRVDDLGWEEQGSSTVIKYRVTRESTSDPGWRPWDGTPLSDKPRDCEVEFKLRDGTTNIGHARTLRWSHRDSPSDIVAFRRIVADESGRPLRIKWKATVNSQPPLPPKTRVKILLRYQVDHDSDEEPQLSGPYVMSDVNWAQIAGSPEYEVVAYEVIGAIPDGWNPYAPTRDGKCPAGLGQVVEVRTRNGNVGRGHAHKFNWKRILRNRDSEIVAWRKAVS